MKTLLLVEDDANIAFALSQYLAQEGFRIHCACTLAEARAALAPPPALIILDWMLPDGQGLELLAQVRGRIPVIFLTAKTDLVDRVVGLEAGAQDYVQKPFEPRELLARIRVQLRGLERPDTILRSGDLQVDLTQHTVTCGGTVIELAPKEFLLLKLLMENPGQVFSREEILNKIWGYDRYPSTRTVDTHVLQLRQKLPGLVIETVRGFGYRLKGAA